MMFVDTAASKSREFFRILVSPVINRYRQEDPRQYPWLEKNMANIVTIGRILSSGVIARGLVTATDKRTKRIYLTALCIDIASDGIDGEIARGLGTISTTGKVIDPLADKIMFGSLAIGLVPYFQELGRKKNSIFTIITVLALALEIRVLITGARVGLVSKSLGIEPEGSNVYGKVKFGLQCIAVLLGWSISDKRIAILITSGLLVVAIPFSDLSNRGHQKQLQKLRDLKNCIENVSPELQ